MNMEMPGVPSSLFGNAHYYSNDGDVWYERKRFFVIIELLVTADVKNNFVFMYPPCFIPLTYQNEVTKENLYDFRSL